MLSRLRVKRLRRDVRAVGPDDRPGLAIGYEAAGIRAIAQRLKDATVAQQVSVRHSYSPSSSANASSTLCIS